jgi:hypothetical protein
MNPKVSSPLILPESYPILLRDIKTRLRESQIKAALAVNQELIQFYWWFGSEIVKHQTQEKWGARVLEKLCKDLQADFAGIGGFSRTNLFRMRSFISPMQLSHSLWDKWTVPLISVCRSHGVITSS